MNLIRLPHKEHSQKVVMDVRYSQDLVEVDHPGVFQFSSCSLAFKLLLRHTTALYLHNDNVWFVLSDSIQ